MLPLFAFWLTCGALTAALTEWSILSTGLWWVLTIVLAICALLTWIRSPADDKDGIAATSALSLILYSAIVGLLSVFNLATIYWVAGVIVGVVMLWISDKIASSPQPGGRAARV